MQTDDYLKAMLMLRLKELSIKYHSIPRKYSSKNGRRRFVNKRLTESELALRAKFKI